MLLSDISAYSSVAPFLIALFKWRRKLATHLPLFLYVTLSFCNETWADIAIRSGHYTWSRSAGNFYVLAETVLLIWQFRNWGLFNRKSWLFSLVLAMIFACWIVFVLLGIGLNAAASWYDIIASFTISIVAISNLNLIFSQNWSDFLKNTNFIVTIACIFFFTYRVVNDVFYMYGLDKDLHFIGNVYTILYFVNLIYNLLVAYGLLWTDRKQPYLLRY